MRTGQQLETFSTTFGFVASVAVHLAAFAYIASATAQFDFDFALTLPAEVEFGLTGEMAMAAAPAPPRATGSPDPRWASAAGQREEERKQPAIDAGIPEDPDRNTDADTGADTDADTGYQLPVFFIDAHGSLGSSASPFCRSSIEIPSGERTKAMRPSRGGRLIVTPASVRSRQSL